MPQSPAKNVIHLIIPSIMRPNPSTVQLVYKSLTQWTVYIDIVKPPGDNTVISGRSAPDREDANRWPRTNRLTSFAIGIIERRSSPIAVSLNLGATRARPSLRRS